MREKIPPDSPATPVDVANPTAPSDAEERDRARHWVSLAEGSQRQLNALRERMVQLQDAIDARKDALAKDAPTAQRLALWTDEQTLLNCQQEVVELDAERRRQLQQALIVCPDSEEALEALAHDCMDRHADAVMARQVGLGRAIITEAVGYLDKLPEGSAARAAGMDHFQGTRRVRVTLPESAAVTVSRFELENKRQVREPFNRFEAKTIDLDLPVGSYCLTIDAPERSEVTYPVHLTHGRDWEAKPPNGPARPLPLPSPADMGLQDRYVPESWFCAGGDPDAPNGLSEERVWLDGFIIRETPVTHRQYLAFVNDVLHAKGYDEASLWLPREQSTSESELGKSIYVHEGDHFVHMLGDSMNEHPVVHITWFEAVAFAHWLAETTGQPWRLPSELEWEKAARGVDRRCFPWGDQFDPMFCIMMDSHVGKPEIRSVNHNLLDCSLYGVRSLAGNTREWCLDRFQAESYPIRDGRLVFPSYDDLICEEFRSCRGGSYGNAAQRTRSGDRDWWFPKLSYVGRGFRIARSWPPTPQSERLQADLGRAYAHIHAEAKARHDVAADHLKKRIDDATSELKEQADQLKELDRQKTMFFQNMSHELRTPLTLILNPLEDELQQQPDNQNLSVATKNSRRLLRLVNQLLDFQKLEAGKKALQLAPLELTRFVRICADYFRSTCSTKGVDFRVEHNGTPFDHEGPKTWLMAEVDALEKIVFNYLSNALKYTPSGGTIVLGIEETKARVRLLVRDSGAGISADGQAKLFQVFSQVDETTTRSYEGTGLGLALVKSLTEEMHGEVGVSSTLGQGSTFWAEFPVCDAPIEAEELAFEVKDWLLAAEQGATGVADDEETLAEGAGELILVVDDLDDMRTLIRNALEKNGHRVATAPNGRAGVEVAQRVRPDLIITDWMMPAMSGPELIDTLKHDPHLGSVPIVLLTAKSDEESKLIGTQIGADSFLGKPFNAQELTSIVSNLLSLKAREREVESLNRMLTETVLKRYLPPDLVDRIVSGELSMDKPAEMRRMTVLFSDLCGFTSASERLGPGRMSAVLNEYLSVMNDVIFRHDGTIDKFIGDAIMVLFGAPLELSPEEQARRACACAIDMQRAMASMQPLFAEAGIPDLSMRIGIHQGDAVVGNFGSEQRSDYTAIGPTVNLASRIESACTPGEVFVSEAIRALLPEPAVTSTGSFALKGVDGPKTLFALRRDPS